MNKLRIRPLQLISNQGDTAAAYLEKRKRRTKGRRRRMWRSFQGPKIFTYEWLNQHPGAAGGVEGDTGTSVRGVSANKVENPRVC